MKRNKGIHIGTSGWHYESWVGTFYPEGITGEGMLSSYADHFKTVELNNSFYQLPAEKSLKKWKKTVPEDFIFGVKASRYITHMKKLTGVDPVRTFLDRIITLGSRLGPVLFQLPPNWKCNPGRLRNFLHQLPDDFRYVFEFRDSSWLNREIYELLEECGAAFCIYDLAGTQSPKEVTTDFVYIRLHGPDAAYSGSYDTQTLAGWAGAISTWADQDREIFCYFDNDQQGYAPRNGLQLQNMLCREK